MLLQMLEPVTVKGNSGVHVLRPRESALLLLHAGQPCHHHEAVRPYAGRIPQALENQGRPPLVMKIHRAYQVDPPTGSLDLQRSRSFLAATWMAHSAGDRESAAELIEKARRVWLSDPSDTPGMLAVASKLALQREEAQTRLPGLRLDLAGTSQEPKPARLGGRYPAWGEETTPMHASPHQIGDLIPHPFSLEQFRLAVERRTGRRLVLELAPLAGAMLIRTGDTDLIIYDQAADNDQQLRAIGHEVAHLLLDHQALERPSPFVHLDPAAVAGTIAFHGYSQEDERQADDFALLLLSAAANAGPTAAQRPAVQPDSD